MIFAPKFPQNFHQNIVRYFGVPRNDRPDTQRHIILSGAKNKITIIQQLKSKI